MQQLYNRPLAELTSAPHGTQVGIPGILVNGWNTWIPLQRLQHVKLKSTNGTPESRMFVKPANHSF